LRESPWIRRLPANLGKSNIKSGVCALHRKRKAVEHIVRREDHRSYDCCASWSGRERRSVPSRHDVVPKRRGRAETVSRTGTIAGTTPIIGAVENVYLKRDCETEKATTIGMLSEMSAASTDAAASRAIASEGISFRSSRAAHSRTGFERLRRQSGNVQNISAPKQDSVEQSEAAEANSAAVLTDAGRTWSRNRVGWALVAACGAALLGILFYFRRRSVGVVHQRFAGCHRGS